VEVLRFDAGTVVLSGGLDGGEIVGATDRR
jgi:hypothetical protein